MSPTKRNLGLNKTHTLSSLECEKLTYKFVSCNVPSHNLWVPQTCEIYQIWEKHSMRQMRHFSSNGVHSCSPCPSFNSGHGMGLILIKYVFLTIPLYLVQSTLLCSPVCEWIDPKSQVSPLRGLWLPKTYSLYFPGK